MENLNLASREELYKLVWSESMIMLAPKFGVSDVAVKKRCKRLGVPTPGKGYWAKLEAGKSVKKVPLPKEWSLPNRKPKVAKSADAVPKLEVPEADYSIAKLIPVVRETAQLAKKAKPGPEGLLTLTSKGTLRMRVSPASLKRALWLWQELLSRLEAHGLTFHC